MPTVALAQMGVLFILFSLFTTGLQTDDDYLDFYCLVSPLLRKTNSESGFRPIGDEYETPYSA
jgi:hypothetical protein